MLGFAGCTQKATQIQRNENKPQPEETLQKESSQFSFKLTDKKLFFSGGYADPSVIKLKDGTYVMYVNTFGKSGSGNLIYTSTDGINWKKTTKKAPGSATARGFITENGVKLYYPTMTPINPQDPPSQMLSATSADGLTFKEDSGIRMKPLKNYAIEGPSVIKLPDGTWRMYFDEFLEESKQERKDGKIFGASSKDGLDWTRDEKPAIESDQTVERIPANWPQALRPFVLKRPGGGYVMLYNSHSKFFVAYSDDGYLWTKMGGLGIKGADIDGFYQDDGKIRVYFGDFSEATSGVVYTGILEEISGNELSELPTDAPTQQNLPPLGNKPPAPPECVGMKATDSNLPESCELYFKLQ